MATRNPYGLRLTSSTRLHPMDLSDAPCSGLGEPDDCDGATDAPHWCWRHGRAHEIANRFNLRRNFAELRELAKRQGFTVRLEWDRDEARWGCWGDDELNPDDTDLIGAGRTKAAAIREALEQARVWEAARTAGAS